MSANTGINGVLLTGISQINGITVTGSSKNVAGAILNFGGASGTTTTTVAPTTTTTTASGTTTTTTAGTSKLKLPLNLETNLRMNLIAVIL